jgi:hypothetical protein
MLARTSAATAALAVAALLRSAPVTPAQLEVPPPPVFLAATGAREFAAADVAWLRMVQVMGRNAAARGDRDGLMRYLDVVTTLDPKFETAYVFAGAALAGDPALVESLDKVLARGDVALPESFFVPMIRAFSAHFGRFDLATAAEHYRRASARRGAPAHLSRLADRLEKTRGSCEDVAVVLGELTGGGQEDGVILRRGWRSVFEQCTRALIEAAAVRYRHTRGRAATSIDDLLADGLAPPSAPRGSCWRLEGMGAVLGPCAPVERGSLP